MSKLRVRWVWYHGHWRWALLTSRGARRPLLVFGPKEPLDGVMNLLMEHRPMVIVHLNGWSGEVLR